MTKCKQCNNKLGKQSKSKPGYTGLCKTCYLKSPINQRLQPGHTQNTEAQNTLKKLAQQKQGHIQ